MRVYTRAYLITNEDSDIQDHIDVEYDNDLKQVCVATGYGGEMSLGFEQWEAVKEVVTKLFMENGDSE